MSTCKRFKKMILDYVEGSLSNADRREIEQHLEDCEGCHSVAEREKQLIEDLHRLGRQTTSEDFDTILRTRIKIENGIGRRRLNELVWSWPAKIPVYGMSLALLLIASVMVFDQIRQHNEPEIPQPYVNTIWYGGNPASDADDQPFMETESVIYTIDRMDETQLAGDAGVAVDRSTVFGLKSAPEESLKFRHQSASRPIQQVVY